MYSGPTSSNLYSRPILIKFDFFNRFSENPKNIKSHENPSSGSQAVPCGRTDRHDEPKVAFRNFASTPENAIPLFKQLKTVHVLDRDATKTG
jgi:hypothetical protein